MKKTCNIIIIIALVAAIMGGTVYLFANWGESCAFLNNIAAQGNIERLKSFILSFGFWAPLISAFLMVAQSVVLFLPAFPIFLVNALSFGLVWGILLSWSSAVLGSILCFTIAKVLGRPVVQRLVNRVHLETADAALRRYEKYIILLFGFIPIISFDIISYASGLTILTYWEFIPLVCIAQIPSPVFYSLLVYKIGQGPLNVYWIVAAVLFLFLGISTLTVRTYLNRKRLKASSLKV